MWWFALIVFLNVLVPNTVLYDDWGFSVAGFRATPLDVLLFAGPLLLMLPIRRPEKVHVERSHPAFRASIALFVMAVLLAALIGATHASSLWRPKWYFAPLRNLALVPIAAWMGYQILRHPRQCRTAVWIIFVASVASAVATMVLGGQTTAGMAESGGSFESLRNARAQASGDSGLIAACLVIYTLGAGVPFLSLPVAMITLAASGLGMLFVAHRSMWLTSAAVLAYAGAVLCKAQRARSIMVSLVLFAAMSVAIVTVVGVVSQRTGRNFGEWVVARLHALLPDDQAYGARAWDSRMPGLWLDLAICAEYPVVGGGFGIHEAHAMRTGKWFSFRHTPWTSTLAESGVIGLAAFALAVGSMIVVGTRLARTAPDRWMMLLGVIAACYGVSAFIFGWVTLSWNTPRQAVMLGLFLGLVLRCRDLALALTDSHASEATDIGVLPVLAGDNQL